jgi:signal recognition particle subunit SRP54
MVLDDLGAKINSVLKTLNSSSVIDDATLDHLLKDISKALLESDVNVKLVQKLRLNIKKLVNFEELAVRANKKKIIQKAIFDELVALVDPGTQSYVPIKGKSNVIMFVGLQVFHRVFNNRVLVKLQLVQSWPIFIRERDGKPLSSVLILFEPVRLIS